MKYTVVAALLFCSLAAAAESIPEELEMRWHPGAEDCTADTTRTESFEIGEDTFVLRQNPCVDYEANLVYLLLGDERALLIDSGAVDGEEGRPLVNEVRRILEEHGGNLPLLVAHTHGHEDHRAGDVAFSTLPDTEIVPYEGEAMRKFFGFEGWPRRTARFDLGARQIVVVPAPGHHPDHVVFFDDRTHLLFTGDFLLPGRLLIDDLDAYLESATGLAEITTSYGVRYALGSHIEMNANGAPPLPELHRGQSRPQPHRARDRRDRGAGAHRVAVAPAVEAPPRRRH